MKQPQAKTTSFATQLKAYKGLIDADIAAYSRVVEKTTLQRFGVPARVEVDAFLSILSRGGKRIRGALTMLGYEMSGGTDQKMILQAARAVEMIHAYILIIDDIQDRSSLRRGGPTAHMMLADYHRQRRLSGDSAHFGMSVALNAANSGNHAAQAILANLDVDAELRLKAVSIMNQTMVVTSHGQTGDIMNEVSADVTQADIDQVLEWKTAHYSILNPLHMGMVLAGADCQATDAITEYAMNVGRAFQITDDVMGTFGTEQESGKSPMDDIREGKRTIVMQYALEHVNSADKNFLLQMLGSADLTQAQFERCKAILTESGAVDHSLVEARKYVAAALMSLDKQSNRWSPQGVTFLRGLAEYLLTRTS